MVGEFHVIELVQTQGSKWHCKHCRTINNYYKEKIMVEVLDTLGMKGVKSSPYVKREMEAQLHYKFVRTGVNLEQYIQHYITQLILYQSNLYLYLAISSIQQISHALNWWQLIL
ncbi:hypothetical protein PPL_11691 [Heterostelium album PN500]|uniref:Uncharacterized protein n=1 Tax=Heterostelium pallidum (strain ATCC 26659 / Pp 5 / PN500) TaxID=670386 RepID=D3BU72_HETP5|nr:hypothetical protein PPL_11691 [Heterostelium album PN500]EFA75006.1 hypothetical protein PPL_11691 [Heterostelium album PN500]|eukprot:XP_020427140.1 hypothetical protein PPL_11691 [Heterostelium album PN500]